MLKIILLEEKCQQMETYITFISKYYSNFKYVIDAQQGIRILCQAQVRIKDALISFFHLLDNPTKCKV